MTDKAAIAPYRVAAVQFEPLLAAKEANVAALLKLVEQAAAVGPGSSRRRKWARRAIAGSTATR
jgi:hypothetical protein